MKRITIVLLALCFAIPAFAGDVDAAVFTVSGNASVTFGMDLDSNATGFANASAADFVLSFGVPTTAMKNGMDLGPVYGEIAFKDIRVELEENDLVDNNIALNYAKIMGSNWWLSVVGPDATIDYENALQNGIIGVAAAWDGQMDKVSNVVANSGGFEFGYTMPDLLAVELSLFSLTDWTSATDTAADNAYGLKAQVGVLAVPNLTFEAALNMGFGSDLAATKAGTAAVYGWLDDMGTSATTDDKALTGTAAAVGTPYWGVTTAAVAAGTTALNSAVGIGAKLAYAIAVGDITITPEVGVDVKLVDDGANIAIGNGLRVAMPGAEVTGAEDAIKDDAGTSVAWDDGVNSGLTLGWDYYMPADTTKDAQLGLQAHYGLSSIANLMVAVGFEVDDLMSDSNKMGFAGWAKYTMGNIAPYAGLFMLVDGKMIANAGATISNVIPKTTFTLSWNSGDLAADEPDLGIVKFETKVSY
jgi:hypothetical protein